METGPLVSVVIAAYRAPEYLKQAVDSVLTQTMKAREMIGIRPRVEAEASIV